MRDDHCATILFDINNLTPGKKETKLYMHTNRCLIISANSLTFPTPNQFFSLVSSSDLSKCDCYVVLKLPTACACCHRTKTVKNSDAPKWNETFRFRVHSGVKVSKSALDTFFWLLLHIIRTAAIL
uniref:C2 domain-containing protein n=1 Tax=Sinocyclocheilus anshuiensis TaxID=1608454 RepID=A0A671RRM1_9TELE